MNDIVKKDILSILSEAIEIVNADEVFKLRELSDHVIHNASIFQDNDSISIAVIIYTIAKIYENSNGKDIIKKHLAAAKGFLLDDRAEQYQSEIKNLLSEISEKGKASLYVSEVLERAQIKKASKIYEHGISLAQVADALGISRWELQEYIGKTTIPDSFDDITDVKSKIKFTREIFS